MSPEQRAELESFVAAQAPSIGTGERERLLFESARALGRQQASQQAFRKSVAAAVASCGLTLLMSWAMMPDWNSHEGMSPTQNTTPAGTLANQSISSEAPVVEQSVKDRAYHTVSTHSNAWGTGKSRFDQDILTPVSRPARWQLSEFDATDTDEIDLVPTDWGPATDGTDARRSQSTPLRAGTPIEHL